MNNYDDPFHGKRGVSVKVYNNNINTAIAQLKRKSNAEGINKELRKRKYFEENTAKRRRKLAEAQMRWRKKQDQINEIVRPKKKKIYASRNSATSTSTTLPSNT
jgi:small subunit ribosomal protein S21